MSNPPDREMAEDCLKFFTEGEPGGTGFILGDGRTLDLGTDHEDIRRCIPKYLWDDPVANFMLNTGAVRTSWGYHDLNEDELFLQSICRHPITDAQKRVFLDAAKRAEGGTWEVLDRRHGRHESSGELSVRSLRKFYEAHERCRVG